MLRYAIAALCSVSFLCIPVVLPAAETFPAAPSVKPFRFAELKPSHRSSLILAQSSSACGGSADRPCKLNERSFCNSEGYCHCEEDPSCD